MGFIVRHVGQLSLTQVFRIGERRRQTGQGIVRASCLQLPLSQPDQRITVLGACLAFSAFPWMETVGAERIQSSLPFPGAVQQGNIAQIQIVPVMDQIRAGLQPFQPLCVRLVQSGRQLVVFQQKTRIIRINGAGRFHLLFSPDPILQLVIAGNGQIPVG